MMVLDAIDHTGNPRDPAISIVPVTKTIRNSTVGHNHANYIDDKGYYNIMKLFDDH